MKIDTKEKIKKILLDALVEARHIDDFIELLKNSNYYIIDVSEPKIYDLLGKINEIEDTELLGQVKIIQDFLKTQ